jgi:hypothetical protein
MTAEPFPIGPAEEKDWRDLALLVTASGLPEGGLRDHFDTVLVALRRLSRNRSGFAARPFERRACAP